MAERAHDITEIGDEWVKQQREQEELLRDLDKAAEQARAEQVRKPSQGRKAPSRQRKR